ncbi:MAG: rRNA maturation RNase YbeY [Chloroflexota bacterium]
MSFEIDIQALVEVEKSLITLIKTAVLTTLTYEKAHPNAQLSLVLSDNPHLQQLNAQFRQKDTPTDILSFPAEPTVGMEHYLGDIVISVNYAQHHAAKEGHTLAEELQLLGVHGTLHLLGYDDIDPPDRKTMWAAQTAVLNELGIQLKVVNE